MEPSGPGSGLVCLDVDAAPYNKTEGTALRRAVLTCDFQHVRDGRSAAGAAAATRAAIPTRGSVGAAGVGLELACEVRSRAPRPVTVTVPDARHAGPRPGGDCPLDHGREVRTHVVRTEAHLPRLEGGR